MPTKLKLYLPWIPRLNKLPSHASKCYDIQTSHQSNFPTFAVLPEDGCLVFVSAALPSPHRFSKLNVGEATLLNRRRVHKAVITASDTTPAMSPKGCSLTNARIARKIVSNRPTVDTGLIFGGDASTA